VRSAGTAPVDETRMEIGHESQEMKRRKLICSFYPQQGSL
ncbi:uncharacterized, partial [Tachysurus ichikawai]